MKCKYYDKLQGPYDFKLLQIFMDGIIPILHKLFQHMGKEEIVSNSFY